MNKPSQEDLLGYVLGAMDAQEQRNIQQVLDRNPQSEDELLEIKNSLLPLDYLDGGGTRPGLARRTVERIAALQRDSEIPSVPSGSHFALIASESTHVPNKEEVNEDQLVMLPSDRSLGAGSCASAWSLPNMLVAAAALAVFAGLMFPALSYSRYQARLVSCENNLQQIGRAFLKFSDMNCGVFIPIPSEGKLAASGCFGPILKQSGLLEDDSLLACAGVADDTPVHIPTVEQLEAADGHELTRLQKLMGGHFGYSMGYQENGAYRVPQNSGRTNVVLLADAPSNTLPGRRSSNHGSRGQNCLFEDGRVQFVSGHSVGRDAIYENDYGIVAPGSHSGDSVIAPSHLSPLGAGASKIEFLSIPR